MRFHDASRLEWKRSPSTVLWVVLHISSQRYACGEIALNDGYFNQPPSNNVAHTNNGTDILVRNHVIVSFEFFFSFGKRKRHPYTLTIHQICTGLQIFCIRFLTSDLKLFLFFFLAIIYFYPSARKCGYVTAVNIICWEKVTESFFIFGLTVFSESDERNPIAQSYHRFEHFQSLFVNIINKKYLLKR